MTVSVYQIPTNMIANLDSKQSGYDTSIQTINSTLTNDVVHRTGDETIGGNKTFTSPIKRNSSIDHTATTGEVEVVSFSVLDKNNFNVGTYNTTRSATTNTNRQRVLNSNVAETGYWYDLRANLKDDGHGYISSAKGSNVIDDSTTLVTNSTSSSVIPTMGWVNNPATSTNVVHRSGDETIGGAKTFTDNITIQKGGANFLLKNSNLTKGTNPSSATDIGVRFRDKDGATVGNIVHMVDTSGNCLTKLESYKQTANSSAAASMTVRYNKDGGAGVQFFTSSPASGDTNLSLSTVSSSTTENYIPTMGWVNNPATSTNVVHRSGDETIGGIKTYTSSIYSSNTSEPLHVYSTTLDYTQTSTTFTSFILGLWDKSNTRVLELKYENRAGDNVLSFPIRDKSGNWHTSLAYVTNGTTAYGTCDTPSSATDNSTKIATTAWVNNHINDSTIKTKIVRWSLLNYNSLVTISNISSGYTAPNDGVVMYNSDSQDNPTINNITIPIAGNDSGNEGPTYLPVAKGDVVKKINSTYNPIFVPFKY